MSRNPTIGMFIGDEETDRRLRRLRHNEEIRQRNRERNAANELRPRRPMTTTVMSPTKPASELTPMQRLSESDRLPSWNNCELANDEKRATALERFIYEYEPGDDNEAREWRERLQAVVTEAKGR